jgi:hypothetical protein
LEIGKVLGDPVRKLGELLVLQDIDEVGGQDARLAEIAPRIREGGKGQVWGLIIKIDEKGIWGLPMQAVLLQLPYREIPQIPGEDDGGAADDLGRDDMTITGIRQGDRANVSLIGGDHCVRQGVLHQAPVICKRSIGMAGTLAARFRIHSS